MTDQRLAALAQIDLSATSSHTRDLAFHVQEHCLALDQIESFLSESELDFLGFELDPHVLHQYRIRFAGDPTGWLVLAVRRNYRAHPRWRVIPNSLASISLATHLSDGDRGHWGRVSGGFSDALSLSGSPRTANVQGRHRIWRPEGDSDGTPIVSLRVIGHPRTPRPQPQEDVRHASGAG